MKHLLLALLAALALPNLANAEQTLLIMEFGVEMNDIEECKREGDMWGFLQIGATHHFLKNK